MSEIDEIKKAVKDAVETSKKTDMEFVRSAYRDFKTVRDHQEKRDEKLNATLIKLAESQQRTHRTLELLGHRVKGNESDIEKIEHKVEVNEKAFQDYRLEEAKESAKPQDIDKNALVGWIGRGFVMFIVLLLVAFGVQMADINKLITGG